MKYGRRVVCRRVPGRDSLGNTLHEVWYPGTVVIQYSFVGDKSGLSGGLGGFFSSLVLLRNGSQILHNYCGDAQDDYHRSVQPTGTHLEANHDRKASGKCPAMMKASACPCSLILSHFFYSEDAYTGRHLADEC